MKRMTRQRSAILDCFATLQRPLNIEEIVAFACKKIPDIHLSTVYRNLRKLIDEGKIIAVELPGDGVRYEISKLSHHHHFLCHTCNRSFNISGCPKDLLKMVPKGFQLQSHSITLSGVCEECLET